MSVTRRIFLLYLCIFCFLEKARASDITLPFHEKDLNISISFSETNICPYDSVALTITLNGFQNGYLQFTYAGYMYNISILSGTRIKYLKEEGDIQILKYGNSDTGEAWDTVINSSIRFKQIPSGVFYGAGSFCKSDTSRNINLSLSGTGPWDVSYQKNNDPVINSTFDDDNQILSVNEDCLIKVFYISDQNCYDSTELSCELELLDVPQAEIVGDTVFCPNSEALFSTDTSSDYTYLWSISDETSYSTEDNPNNSDFSLKWIKAGSFSLNLRVQDNNSCFTNQQKDILVYEAPDVKTDFDTLVCFGSDGYITLYPVSSSDNTIIWNDLQLESPSIDISEEGTYTYIETTPFGCSAEGSINVTERCLLFFVPEAFTPNNDNTNDILAIFGKFEGFNMYIYSGNGQLVQRLSPENPTWDGTIDNSNAPMGVYYWKAEFYDAYGTQYFKEGNITLLR